MEPRYNEGPTDWKNVLCNEVSSYQGSFFVYFTITGVKKIVHYIDDFAI